MTVKFSKGENDRSLKWKEKSYSTMIKREEEEPWIDMKFNQVIRNRQTDNFPGIKGTLFHFLVTPNQ